MLYGMLICIAGPLFWIMVGSVAFESGSIGKYVCILLGILSLIYGINLVVNSMRMPVVMPI